MDGWVVVVNIEWLEAKFWTDLDGRSTPNNYPTTNQSIQYSIYLSTHQSVQIRPINPYISIHQSIHLHPSTHGHRHIYPESHATMDPSSRPSIKLFTYLNIPLIPPSTNPFFHQSIHPFIHQPNGPSIHPSMLRSQPKGGTLWVDPRN